MHSYFQMNMFLKMHCLTFAKEQSHFLEYLIIDIYWRNEIKCNFSRDSVHILSWKRVQILPHRKIRKLKIKRCMSCICYSCCLLNYQEVLGWERILSQSFLKPIFSSCTVWGGQIFCETLLQKASQTCSTGIRSREYASHFMQLISSLFYSARCLSVSVWALIVVHK